MPDIRFVVDTDVLITLERAGQMTAVSAIGLLPVVITDTVWAEFAGPQPGRSPVKLAAYQTFLNAIAGAATVITPQSPEAGTYLSLYDPRAKMNEGESTVIAYAVHHADAVTVLLDKTPLQRSLEELKGRTISLHCFLEVLIRLGLTKTSANAVSKYRARSGNPPPLWW